MLIPKFLAKQVSLKKNFRKNFLKIVIGINNIFSSFIHHHHELESKLLSTSIKLIEIYELLLTDRSSVGFVGWGCILHVWRSNSRSKCLESILVLLRIRLSQQLRLPITVSKFVRSLLYPCRLVRNYFKTNFPYFVL
jgi:hypothetical protein